jgi:hypothetical protein
MLLTIIKDKMVYVYDRTIQMRKQNRHKTTANYRRLSGIELPWMLREGLSLDMRRLS